MLFCHSLWYVIYKQRRKGPLELHSNEFPQTTPTLHAYNMTANLIANTEADPLYQEILPDEHSVMENKNEVKRTKQEDEEEYVYQESVIKAQPQNDYQWTRFIDENTTGDSKPEHSEGDVEKLYI